MPEGAQREAPLILVPVSLSRDPRRSTFDLKVRDDDIATNLPLAERLKADVGVTLPPIPEDDEWTPSAYFEATETAIALSCCSCPTLMVFAPDVSKTTRNS